MISRPLALVPLVAHRLERHWCQSRVESTPNNKYKVAAQLNLASFSTLCRTHEGVRRTHRTKRWRYG